MLRHCVNELRRRGCATLAAEFIATERNEPARDFLGSHGFSKVAEPGRGAWNRLFPQIQPGSGLFIAQLETMVVPNLESYDKVA